MTTTTRKSEAAAGAPEPDLRLDFPGRGRRAGKRPRVSVYLPTRDRPAELARAVTSVLDQSYPNLQLVVVDDGSAAPTLDCLRRLGEANATTTDLRVLRLATGGGACRARNVALAACDGELVTGLDDDDYFLPGRIERLVAAFDPQRSGFVFDGYWRETVATGAPRRVRIPLARPATLPALLRRNIAGNQVLTLASRLRQLGGFDESLPAWQDYDLWLRLARAYGAGQPAGGISYVHSVDSGRPRISGDPRRIVDAAARFAAKHPEYAADPRLRLCLRLAQCCYGIDALAPGDLPALLTLGEPRYVAFALWSWWRLRPSRRS